MSDWSAFHAATGNRVNCAAMQCVNSVQCLSASTACGTGLFAILFYVIYEVFFHPLAKYPGPYLARVTQWYDVYHAFIGDKHVLFHRLHQKYGPVVRYAPNALSINDPVALKAIYGHGANVQKAVFYKCFRAAPTAISTLLATEKHHHARKRRVMGQAFSEQAMRGLEQHVLSRVQDFVERLEDVVSDADRSSQTNEWSKAENMARWCNWLVFDIMGDLVFGKSFGTLGSTPENRRGIYLLGRAARRNYTIAAMPTLASTGLEKYLPFFRGLYFDRVQYLAFGKKQVMERAQRDKASKENPDASKGERQDIFSFLLGARDPETNEGMPMNELFMEGNTLIVAGSDTTSTTLSAVIFYLLNNPACLNKVVNEVRSTFNSPSEIFMNAQMRQCVYLRACIDETLRMTPAVAGVLPREVLKGGFSIPSMDIHIPAGIDVGVPIYAIQHHATYIPDPFAFTPERWLSSESTSASRESLQSCFAPFLIGNRACLGKPLVYMELSISIARLLFQFDIRRAPSESQPHNHISKQLPGLEQPSNTRNIARDVRDKKRDKDEYHVFDWFLSHNEGPMAELRRREKV